MKIILRVHAFSYCLRMASLSLVMIVRQKRSLVRDYNFLKAQLVLTCSDRF